MESAEQSWACLGFIAQLERFYLEWIAQPNRSERPAQRDESAFAVKFAQQSDPDLTRLTQVFKKIGRHGLRIRYSLEWFCSERRAFDWHVVFQGVG